MSYKIGLFFSLAIFSSCFYNLEIHENELVKETPDKTLMNKCSLFIKTGGATVGNSYHISILSCQNKLSKKDIGNVFIADDHDGTISSDISWVNFKWIAKDSLLIIFDKKLRVFKRETNVENVSILFDTISLTTL